MEEFEKEQEAKTEGCLEKLLARIYELKRESGDYYFTEYLTRLQEKALSEKHAVDLLSEELGQKHRLYQERMAQGLCMEERPKESASAQQERTEASLADSLRKRSRAETASFAWVLLPLVS